MHNDPLRAQLRINIDVSLQIFFDGVAYIRRILGDVDGRQGMQTELNPVLFTCGAHACCAAVVESRECVGRCVELDIDKTHGVFRRPLDSVFELCSASNINAYSLPKAHAPLLTGTT